MLFVCFGKMSASRLFLDDKTCRSCCQVRFHTESADGAMAPQSACNTPTTTPVMPNRRMDMIVLVIVSVPAKQMYVIETRKASMLIGIG